MISFFQLIQIRKQCSTWQTSVGGDNRMGALASHRQGTSFQMPCPDLQHFLIGGMINRKLHINLRDLHNSHDLITVDIETAHIFFIPVRRLRHSERIGKDHRHQRVIISSRPRPLRLIINLSIGVLLRHAFLVTAHQPALPVTVPLVGNEGIQQYGQPG